ncbi:MAG: ferrochelatase [Planctomycetes bacterium]|nr:ferrochelatase [Planctomycetota bacterium]
MLRLISGKVTAANVCGERRASPPRRRGVLLVNVGTPAAQDVSSVRRYLAEFLSDPLVLRLPTGLGWLQGALARLIAWSRAPRSARKYQEIWTERGSPLKAIMEDQATALQAILPKGWQVFLGMRYGRPGIAAALEEIEAAGIEELVVVPLYPQFSRTTTGTVVRELYRALKHVGQHINVATRTTWYDDIGYISAQARLIAEYATANGLRPEDTYLLFSAHGLPVSYVREGDPYARHVRRTVQLVTQRLGWPAERTSLAYQSRFGLAEWLKPDSREQLAELAQAGEKKVVVCSISCTVDCLETLEEVNIRYRADFEANGGRFYLCPALNTYEPFVKALENLVLRGPRPMTSWGTDITPLLTPSPTKVPDDMDLGSLVMVGVSLPNQGGRGRGPRLRYCEPSQLLSVRKPQSEVDAVLQTVREKCGVREALVWNTCHRIEFYGWLADPNEPGKCRCAFSRVGQQLFGDEPEGLAVNVLFGWEAWHHLVRTVAGLNSGLPGDKDIVEQLRSAYRIAERAGTAKPWARHLVEEAVALERSVRAETAWGRYDPGYCYASLSRIREAAGLDLPNCRHVVIGGSCTSRSVLETLFERFDVQRSQMALVYRSHHGGQIKLLRKAIGNGKRVRVNTYTEQAVVKAISEADIVYSGIDRNETVLEADTLGVLRDFKERPLTIIDFNTFGSTSGVETVEGVTLWSAEQLEKEVAAYARKMCEEDQFGRAREETEAWIEQHLPKSAASRMELPCKRNGNGTARSCIHCFISEGRTGSGSNGQ